jgi:BirA family biotin operon repressor/biotin-[acetyl-CoA-carboxylase] ligase
MIDLAPVRARFPGRQIAWFESCATTMAEAEKLASQGCPSGSAAGAEEQTAGHRRYGRAWHSKRGEGLYVSIVLRLSMPDENIPALSLALGLAAAEAIARATGLACDLRWPNDVLIGEKKCAGILVEGSGAAYVAGIGINVNQTEFPEEIAAIATSLRAASGRTHSREQLLIHLLECVDSFTKMLVEGGREPVLRAFARASSYVKGKRVVVEQRGVTIAGTTDGLDPTGFLYVRQPNGERTLVLAGGVRPASH